MAYYDKEDYIYIVDRFKEVFKCKSYTIVPKFLESILLEHPSVKEAAIFRIPHEEDRNHPAALVTLKKKNSVTVEEIELFFSNRVSENNKLRGGIKIVDELDKTPSGKLQRNKLLDRFLNE